MEVREIISCMPRAFDNPFYHSALRSPYLCFLFMAKWRRCGRGDEQVGIVKALSAFVDDVRHFLGYDVQEPPAQSCDHSTSRYLSFKDRSKPSHPASSTESRSVSRIGGRFFLNPITISVVLCLWLRR
jgi:hypothetical protein